MLSQLLFRSHLMETKSLLINEKEEAKVKKRFSIDQDVSLRTSFLERQQWRLARVEVKRLQTGIFNVNSFY